MIFSLKQVSMKKRTNNGTDKPCSDGKRLAFTGSETAQIARLTVFPLWSQETGSLASATP